MITCKNISKSFGDVTVLHDVSFQIENNKTLGVLGPNGAGKSTTLKILSTLIKPDSGSVSIDGFDLMTNQDRVRELIAYLPESPPLYPELTVFEYLKLFGELRNSKIRKDALRNEIEVKIKIKM